jgi:hypothetical protein
MLNIGRDIAEMNGFWRTWTATDVIRGLIEDRYEISATLIVVEVPEAAGRRP